MPPPSEDYLLDTCVLGEGDERVEAWLATVKDSQLFVSVASIMEQRKGIELLRPKKPDVAAEIEQDLNDMIAQIGDEKIIPIDKVIADKWGRLLARHPQKARTNVCVDAVIAASAIDRFCVATRNVDDFRGLGFVVINPFRNPAERIS
jgi:predicted nucleic acid-binding protein